MALSFGVPIGLVIAVIGIVLFFATKYKKTAKVIIGIGTAAFIMTLIMVFLAANSQM
jgi:low affinity Fe/Cu permease